MALEWLGDLARKINSVVTTPSQQATQLAGQYSEDNPWRTRIGLMTGTPPVDVLQQASNWDINNRNTRLAEDQFAAQTVNVTPETLAKTGLYSPDNLNAPYVMTPGQRRYISDVTGVNNTENSLRQRDKTRTAQASVLNGLQPYLDQLKATPQGIVTLNALQNPDAFPTEEWGKTYGQIPGIIQGGINRTTQAGSTRQMVEAMPDGSTKTYLKQLLPLLDLPGMEGVNDFIYKSALGSVPKALTPYEQAQIRHLDAQNYRLYHPVSQNSSEGKNANSYSVFGFNSEKDAKAWIDNLNTTYNTELKKNGGKFVTTSYGGEWIYPNGQPTPSIDAWVKKKLGEAEYRKYLGVLSGNPDYMDASRSLAGIQNKGLIQNEWDLTADQLVTKFKSFAKAKNYAVSNHLDQRLIAALERRKRFFEQSKTNKSRR
jgi:hypothetical protein